MQGLGHSLPFPPLPYQVKGWVLMGTGRGPRMTCAGVLALLLAAGV